MSTAASTGFVLGIDFGGTKVALRTARPSAEPLASSVLPTLAERGAVQVVSRALSRAAQLVAETERAHGGRLRFLPRLAAALADVPFPPALVPARFRTEAPLMGALAMAIDALEDTPAADPEILDEVAAGTHT